MKALFSLSLAGFAAVTMILSGCSDDDAPPPENEEEVINEVTLTFTTPAAGGAARQFSYTDPDGPGSAPATAEDILLEAGTLYTMSISFKNTLGDAEIDLTQEIRQEGDEHQIFFAWTGPLFSSPKGLGNLGTENQSIINYVDEDTNKLPVGLATIWETIDTPASGTFRIVLKHQPDIKSVDSSSEDGVTDVDVKWNITIE